MFLPWHTMGCPYLPRFHPATPHTLPLYVSTSDSHPLKFSQAGNVSGPPPLRFVGAFPVETARVSSMSPLIPPWGHCLTLHSPETLKPATAFSPHPHTGPILWH